MTSRGEPASAGFDPATAGDVWDPGRVVAQARSENFPVASILLGRDLSRHFLAIYGYARLVDDVGDEAAGDRSAQLDALEHEVRRLYEGTPRHPLLRRLARTVAECDVPARPLLDLIEANRVDQLVSVYETFDELRDYCRLSANSVGELVLYVLGAHTPENVALSGAICTGLQITEHLQDVAEDHARGRVYLPREDLVRFGCTYEDLSAPSPSEGFRRLIVFEARRARDLLDTGAPLISGIEGRGRLAVAGFVAGGRTALDSVVAARGDVLTSVPRPSKRTFARHFAGAVLRRR